MDGLIVLAFLAGPAAATYALRKTPVFWLPSAALLGGGLLALGALYSGDRSGHDLEALAAVALAYGAAYGLGYGLLCLVVVAAYRGSIRRRPPAIELPAAVVIRDEPRR
ncbi:MAG TPA: hypothetical protein VHT91_25035 [Kofleriaceae bacterium]|jgi:hypothetical protein|nr:hypothetical protein [Kofleriaceae bacterium]